MKLFYMWTSRSGDVVYLQSPILTLAAILFAEFSSGHYGEHLCEIILNVDQLFRRRCCLSSKFNLNTGGHSFFANGSGHYRGHLCEIILNLDQ